MQRNKAGSFETCGEQLSLAEANAALAAMFEQSPSLKLEDETDVDFVTGSPSRRRSSRQASRRRPQIRYGRGVGANADESHESQANMEWSMASVSHSSADLTSCVAALCDSAYENTVDMVVKREPLPEDFRLIRSGSNRPIGRPLKTAAYLDDIMAAQLAHFHAAAAIVPTNEAERLEAAFCKRQYNRILATERQRQRRARMSDVERAEARELNRQRIRRRRDDLKQLAERALAAGISAETHSRLNKLRRSLGMRPISDETASPSPLQSDGGVGETVDSEDSVTVTVKVEERPMSSDPELVDLLMDSHVAHSPNDLLEQSDERERIYEDAYFLRERERLIQTSVKRRQRAAHATARIADATDGFVGPDADVGLCFEGRPARDVENDSVLEADATSTSHLTGGHIIDDSLPKLFDAIEASVRKCRALAAAGDANANLRTEVSRIKARLAEVETRIGSIPNQLGDPIIENVL